MNGHPGPDNFNGKEAPQGRVPSRERIDEMIPSIEDCFSYMKTYRMLDNIRAHSVVVARVAQMLARELRAVNGSLSMERVVAGALMHDIGKTRALESGENHADLGRRICLDHDLVEIAGIVGEHVQLSAPDLKGEISEKEIVYYADKRVNHDRVVPLAERLSYILERYAKNDRTIQGRIMRNFEFCRAVEKKLFRPLPMDPQDVPDLVEKERLGFNPTESLEG